MPGYQVATTIEAPIDVVWDVLSDVTRMPEWTSSMRSVRLLGSGALGRTSRVRIKQPWLPASTWSVELFEPPQYFSWRSRTGLVETVGGHRLEDRGDATEVTFTIRHSGPGAEMVGLLIGPLTRRYVDLELGGLRTRVAGGGW